jgi:glycosyltransferase involved in cell wall biosynthesis
MTCSAADGLTISVIIPTYNRAKYLRDAIDSALNQSRVPDEILVIDDGSTDETSAVLAQYDSPTRVIRQHNRGRSAARNVGLDEASGDAIMFLDSDDVLLPTNLERCASALAADPNVGVIYSDALIIDADGQAVEIYTGAMPGPRPSGMVLGELSRRCFLTISSLVRRAAIGEVRFDPRMSHAEDYDFWRRLAGRWAFQYIDEPLMCYRYHELMTVHTGLVETLRAELEVQQRIMRTADFAALPAIERARTYCAHGAKNAILDREHTAKQYFARAMQTAPYYVGGYVLAGLSLLGNRVLKSAIMKRRHLLGNQLGTNMGQRALSHLGGSRQSRQPAYGRARAQLAAFSGRSDRK